MIKSILMKLFKSGQNSNIQNPHEIEVVMQNVSSQNRNNIEDDEISDLLKKATDLKKESKLDESILLLKKAYLLFPKTDIDYGIEPYLRLPMYLQAADRSDEAWHELNQLLAGNYHRNSEFGYYINLSKIHDKCRLFLEREKKYKLAMHHLILGFIYDAKHYFCIMSDANARQNLKTIGKESFDKILNGREFYLDSLSNSKCAKYLKVDRDKLNKSWVPIYNLLAGGFKSDEEEVLQELLVILKLDDQKEGNSAP